MRLKAVADKFGDYLDIFGEAYREAPLQAPGLFAKMFISRVVYDIGPEEFLIFDLPNRPLATWKNYLRQYPHNSTLLHILHPQPEPDVLARDKVLSSERCAEHGIAFVPILAVVGRDSVNHPCAGRFPLLNTHQSIVDSSAAWPGELFIKPAASSFGQGAMALTRVGDRWQDGERSISDDELADILLSYRDPRGVLVQPRVSNDPELWPIGADYGLSAVRIITALTESGPEIFACLQKILGRKALADNFSDGFAGNLIGIIDPETGRLGLTYGRKPGHKHLLTRFDRHPGTGQVLNGFQLPQWDAAIDMAKRAAVAFPELPLLGHDIAITTEGPMFLETNTYWRAGMAQLAAGGLRPKLKSIIPRLAVPEEVKANALQVIASGKVAA